MLQDIDLLKHNNDNNQAVFLQYFQNSIIVGSDDCLYFSPPTRESDS